MENDKRKNADKPAYPSEFEGGEYDFTGQPIIAHRKYYGLTKREYFAAMALSGLASLPDMNIATICKYSVQCADELLKQLDLEK